MLIITEQGAFTSKIRDAVNANFAEASMFPSGNVYYLDPFNGSDQNDGKTPTTAKSTLAGAYALLVEGHNDTAALISNGLSTSSARLSTGFTWAKNEAHLVGVCAPNRLSQRSRIAPTSGITAFAAFFTISGSGCLFRNVQLFHGFTSGVAASICAAVSGAHDVFQNVHFAGMGDTTSATSATSRNLKISGDENLFQNCTIGLDTVTRTGANASIEFSGGAARSVFENCLLPIYQGAGGASLFIKTSAAASMDRFQEFHRCTFINAIGSGATTQTAASTLAASSGGILLMKDCTLVGCTDWASDATTFAQMYVDGAAPTANTSGLAVAMS